MHKAERARKITGTGGKDKTVVLGVRQRGGEVRPAVVTDRKKPTLQAEVRRHIEPGAAVYTDTVDHAERHVDGQVHTNGIENFSSLVKRGLQGTYISVEPFHLFRYLDERVLTYNLRELNDYGRFEAVLRDVSGRRLTWAEVTGQR